MKMLDRPREERVRLALTNAGTLKMEEYELINEYTGLDFRTQNRSKSQEEGPIYDGERPLKNGTARIKNFIKPQHIQLKEMSDAQSRQEHCGRRENELSYNAQQ